VGHLGIFVSGQVAQKEHRGIVSVLETINRLRPGLYGMQIREGGEAGAYDVFFRERQLEDMRLIDKDGRIDEKPFEAVKAVSEMNERAYLLCGRHLVRRFATERTAAVGRLFHPLRVRHWALSGINPVLWPVPAAAEAVKRARAPVSGDNPFRRIEEVFSKTVSASLDLYRDLRDAWAEWLFFQTYSPMIVFGVVEDAKNFAYQRPQNPRELPVVKEALAAIERGGTLEALARIVELAGKGAGEIPLDRLVEADRWVKEAKLLDGLSEEDSRRIRIEQAIIAGLEPARALETLPKLLPAREERERVLRFLDRIISAVSLSERQHDILRDIRRVLSAGR